MSLSVGGVHDCRDGETLGDLIACGEGDDLHVIARVRKNCLEQGRVFIWDDGVGLTVHEANGQIRVHSNRAAGPGMRVKAW